MQKSKVLPFLWILSIFHIEKYLLIQIADFDHPTIRI